MEIILIALIMGALALVLWAAWVAIKVIGAIYLAALIWLGFNSVKESIQDRMSK